MNCERHECGHGHGHLQYLGLFHFRYYAVVHVCVVWRCGWTTIAPMLSGRVATRKTWVRPSHVSDATVRNQQRSAWTARRATGGRRTAPRRSNESATSKQRTKQTTPSCADITWSLTLKAKRLRWMVQAVHAYAILASAAHDLIRTPRATVHSKRKSRSSRSEEIIPKSISCCICFASGRKRM